MDSEGKAQLVKFLCETMPRPPERLDAQSVEEYKSLVNKHFDLIKGDPNFDEKTYVTVISSWRPSMASTLWEFFDELHAVVAGG